MASENYVYIAQFFYVIQNIARIYFFTSTLELKHNDLKHRIIALIAVSALNQTLTNVIFDNFFLKIGIDVIFTTALFKVMSVEKLSKIILYVMLLLNLEMIYELVISFSVIVTIGPNAFHSDSYIFNIILQMYFTFMFSMVVVVAANVLKKKTFQISFKLAVLVACLSALQSSVMLTVSYGVYLKVTTERLILPVIGALLSYLVLKIIMKRIYMEYKYKKNVAYFVEQYEESLEKYIELKEHDEEISYLRHEILNQLDTLEASTFICHE
ncbi:hypothetical protein [Amedibacillus sp. YH-ame10]